MRVEQRRKDTSRAWEPKEIREFDKTSYGEVTRAIVFYSDVLLNSLPTPDPK